MRTVPLRICTFAALILACSAAHADRVYQWKDANGVTQYSDKPPQGQKYQDRRIDNRGAATQGTTATQESKPKENAECTTARSNLALLESGGPIQIESTVEGEPSRNLNDDERDKQRNLAEAAVKAYCTAGS